LGAPADLYKFDASAGDVISVEMQSDGDAHLYLLGPASAGNPLIAEDDEGSPNGSGDSLLAATLAVAGTYTIVAANNNFLFPPDPPDQILADVVNYVLFVQKCPFRQVLDLSAAQPLTQHFTGADCFGSGGIPVASYAVSGTAGQFVTAAVSSNDFDPFVRVLGPDGSKVENDNNLFDSTSTARVNRILPADGTYFVEASAGPDAVVNITSSPPPAFTVQAQTCATTPAQTGTITGTFTAADCRFADGRRFDVFRFPGVDPTAPRFATISPPANGCVVGLMAEGPQVPTAGACNPGLTEFAVLGSSTYGFVVASSDATATTAVSYSARFSLCPAVRIGYGDSRSGNITSGGCLSADGAISDGVVFRGLAGLVGFNDGASVTLSASFPLGAVLTDLAGSAPVPAAFSEGPDSMLSVGSDLLFFLRIRGSTLSDRGSYTLSIDPAWRRQ
jgi:hypothetical protein